MEPLESRIARLAPEQQQEVGDFVDFLLLKNTIRQTPAIQPSLIMVKTPPVMMPDPAPLSIPPLQPAQSLPQAPLPASPAPVIHAEEELSSSIHEITAGGDDWITRDYMDYGQFDEKQSPATEAVAKVRKKIIAREEMEKPHNLLDWVD